MVIDTDPGIDDCIALLLALASPELDVRGVVTSYGNTTLARATRNARETLRRAASRVPVRPGADRPLRRPPDTGRESHGPSGLGYAAVPPEAPVEPDPHALATVLGTIDVPVVLVTLGPLTNLALALERDEQLVRSRVRDHIAMAGSLMAPGSMTVHSEFNAWADPEAMTAVAEADLGTRWAGLDVTPRFWLGADEVEVLAAGTERDRWLADALRWSVERHRVDEGLDGCVLGDPLAIAELVSPGILKFDEAAVEISLEEGESRGRTAPAASGIRSLVASGIHPEDAHALLAERVFGR